MRMVGVFILLASSVAFVAPPIPKALKGTQALPTWGLPKGAKDATDKPDGAGGRTIEYDESSFHHKIVVDKDGNAEEVITKSDKEKPVSRRKFKVRFDKESGDRIEEETEKGEDGSERTKTARFTSDGWPVESIEEVFTPAKDTATPDKKKNKVTKYGEKGKVKEVVEEDLEYTLVDLTLGRQLTKGKRTTTPHKDGKTGKPKKEHWEPENQKWVEDK